MEAVLVEWLSAALRVAHVLAAILWIGDSFLFMWMDSSLGAPAKPRDGDVAGELWMVHSGGFYEVVKRRTLAPAELPGALHWFKWQAYSTWITGFLLLAVVYWLGRGVALVEPGSGGLGPAAAAGASLALLVAGWLGYDALWASPLAARPAAATAISWGLLAALALGLPRLFAGRAAFLQLGAMLGTVMAATVWRRIIPAQSRMLAATRAGTAMDARLGARAKQRSIHNHYLTLPVLFAMLANHLPSAWGGRWKGVVLLLALVAGALLKHAMLARARHRGAAGFAAAAAFAGAIALTLPAGGAGDLRALATRPSVPFAEVEAIVRRRCVSCHARHPSNPSFPEPPSGMILETPEQVRAHADRILVRAVTTRTMPLGNLTGMTEEERQTLGAWIAQGARSDAR